MKTIVDSLGIIDLKTYKVTEGITIKVKSRHLLGGVASPILSFFFFSWTKTKESPVCYRIYS